LIVITVVAGVMLYGFVTGFMTKTSSSSNAVAQISIASASVSYTYNTATISLTNTGTPSVTIEQVNLLNATTGALLMTTTDITPTTTISGGQTVTLTATFPTTPGIPASYNGKTVLVQVVTSTGSYAETYTVVGP